MPLERQLDNIELQVMHYPSAVVVEYQGELVPEAMQEAYWQLCRRHPVLRTRVERRGADHFLVMPDETFPEVAVHDGGGEEHLRRVGLEWRLDRAVSQLTVVTGSGRGLVAMFTDHLIADGKAKSALFDELCALYGAILNGTPLSVEVGTALPAAPTDVLRSRVGDEAMPPVVHVSDPRDFVGVEALRRYIRLTERQTSRLVAVAKANGTSVHAVLCGVILLAQRRHWTDTAESKMVCLAPVNLRERVSPRVGALDTTNFIGVSPAEVKVEPDTDPIALGREVKQLLETAIANRQPEQEILARTSGSQSPPVGQDLGTAAISNLGVVPEYPQVPLLRIVDFQVFTHCVKGATPSYAAYTYQGRLGIEAFYRSDLYPAAQADGLVAEIGREIGGLLGDEYGDPVMTSVLVSDVP
ncbi:hypothetical protein GCM10017786_34700 [Amycolatopsis deserti]|uniref:Phthiocerol/phthiodiolone dimycocerosyl transferase n=1 Tax=Amycolatopsis deserti TaxID=185696 RepID=A0ABQ3J0N4_9PSEU|nr:hypothetical protein [Amycolatopsis deserti]GHE98810.1 hypothetical protein GCM10017786_34700 [Amycolatopsis deserti]